MVLEFLVIFFILLLLVIKKNGLIVLSSDLFWIFTVWIFLLGIYYSSGIDYTYPLSLKTIFYLIVGFTIYFLFRWIGLHVIMFKTQDNIENKMYLKDESHINTITFFFISLIGSIIYILDIIRVNGFSMGTKPDYAVSKIGALSFVFVPIMLVIWIYEINYSIRYGKKVKLRTIFAFIVYFIISLVISGRQSIFYLLLATIVSVPWSLAISGKNQSVLKILKNNKIFNKLRYPFLILLIIIITYFIFLSDTRYGNGYIQMYEYFMATDFPDSIIKQSEMLGYFGKIYLNIIVYFSHQLSKLEIVFKYYDGPYLLGLYQLNIISRRLPLSWGLDYRLVSISKRSILESIGQMGLASGWDTIWGSLISDFGRIGSIVVVAILGLIVGKNRKKFNNNKTVAYLVTQSLICVGIYSTVQIGPFFDIGWLYAVIWWKFILVINRNKISKNKNFKF